MTKQVVRHDIFCVTGGGGFIGRHLVAALLERGFKVRVLTRSAERDFPKGVEVFKGDLALKNGLPQEFLHDCHFLFHCAGEIHDTSIMHTLHVDGTKQLIEAVSNYSACGKTEVHWVQLSSVGVYGSPSRKSDQDSMILELSDLSPVGEYETTKAMSDRLVQLAGDGGFFSYSILRPSNVFGRGMDNKSLLSLIEAIKSGKFFYIGERGAVATYVHVNDVVNALIECALNPVAKGKIYNLSCDCFLEELVSCVSRLAGVREVRLRIPEALARLLVSYIGRFIKIPLTQNRISSLVSQTRYPADKIVSELGFSFSMPMPQSIADIL